MTQAFVKNKREYHADILGNSWIAKLYHNNECGHNFFEVEFILHIQVNPS